MTAISGFIYEKGVFRAIMIQGENTELACINDFGSYDGQNTDMEFLSVPGQPLYTINYPGSVSTGVGGINNLGDVVGDFADDDYLLHGFLLSGGVYKLVDMSPGNLNTRPTAINDNGVIVGTFARDGLSQGFIYKDETFSAFRVKGAQQTFLSGINVRGQLSGYYTDASNTQFGFIATPVAH